MPAGAATILVVEDDHDIQTALAAILREEGLAAATADNGAEALALLRGGLRPAVILLDLMMPVMNGAQFRAAQLEDPELAGIPVVVLTADGRFEQAAWELAADASFGKPFEIPELLRTVRRLAAPAATPPSGHVAA
jgi:CheY-like chemotaxis protein